MEARWVGWLAIVENGGGAVSRVGGEATTHALRRTSGTNAFAVQVRMRVRTVLFCSVFDCLFSK